MRTSGWWSGKRTHFGGKGGGEVGEAHNVGKEHSDAWMAVSHLGLYIPQYHLCDHPRTVSTQLCHVPLIAELCLSISAQRCEVCMREGGYDCLIQTSSQQATGRFLATSRCRQGRPVLFSGVEVVARRRGVLSSPRARTFGEDLEVETVARFLLLMWEDIALLA